MGDGGRDIPRLPSDDRRSFQVAAQRRAPTRQGRPRVVRLSIRNAAAHRGESQETGVVAHRSRRVDGIGNAYSDEILHAAKLSPFQRSTKLSDEEVARLHGATQRTLREWIDRLRKEARGDFPKKVTAFRKEMAVHGKYKEPCPVCGSPVQRIRYAANEANYCATCQTGGRVLADRSLSRLLKADWPRSLEEWEAKIGG